MLINKMRNTELLDDLLDQCPEMMAPLAEVVVVEEVVGGACVWRGMSKVPEEVLERRSVGSSTKRDQIDT